MKVLLDECAPKPLKTYLATHGHQCRTAPEAGWSGIENGELLALADATFDVLVTILVDLSPHFPGCAEALKSIHPGQVVEVGGGQPQP
jgi:hypothetical protein